MSTDRTSLASLPLGTAVVSLIGGAVGYAKAGSARSLGGGIILAGAFGYAGYHVAAGEEDKGHRLATIAGALTTAGMGMRLMRTRKVMPAGVLVMLGIANTLVSGSKVLDDLGM